MRQSLGAAFTDRGLDSLCGRVLPSSPSIGLVTPLQQPISMLQSWANMAACAVLAANVGN